LVVFLNDFVRLFLLRQISFFSFSIIIQSFMKYMLFYSQIVSKQSYWTSPITRHLGQKYVLRDQNAFRLEMFQYWFCDRRKERVQHVRHGERYMQILQRLLQLKVTKLWRRPQVSSNTRAPFVRFIQFRARRLTRRLRRWTFAVETLIMGPSITCST